jgi:hypothetical protein
VDRARERHSRDSERSPSVETGAVPAGHPPALTDADEDVEFEAEISLAKILGDTIGTVEKHYTPFVGELRERVRSILENGSGLESPVTPASQFPRQIQ